MDKFFSNFKEWLIESANNEIKKEDIGQIDFVYNTHGSFYGAYVYEKGKYRSWKIKLGGSDVSEQMKMWFGKDIRIPMSYNETELEILKTQIEKNNDIIVMYGDAFDSD